MEQIRASKPRTGGRTTIGLQIPWISMECQCVQAQDWGIFVQTDIVRAVIIRRPLQSVERVGISASSHPAKPVQPAKTASQASQPARPASQASRASKPQASRHRCQQFFFIGAPARFLRPPQGATRGAQGATGGITFWHPQHQGGQPNMPQTHQISMIWQTFQQIESWDDHFRDLGYPSKFYRVQDHFH